MFPTALSSLGGQVLKASQKLPVWMQDAMVTGYGVFLHQMRYGSAFREHREWLSTTESWSPEQIESFQSDTFRRLIEHAIAHVPHYRDTLPGILGPSGPASLAGLSSAEMLARLPILPKGGVRDAPRRFLREGVPRWKTISKGTSGTTGTPMVFFAQRDEIQRYWAYADRARNWAGTRNGDRRATFSGLPLLPIDNQNPPFWRRDRVENKLVFSIYHLSKQTMPYYVEKLNEFKPEEMLGHPSCMGLLAALWPPETPPTFKPKAIITSGETVYEFQRTRVREVFDQRISDQYSAGGEMGPVISTCEEGFYHEHPESGIIELVDENMQPVPDGEPGEIVITGFANWTMPLLRYVSGDRSQVMTDGPCPCGRAFRRFAFIEGKSSDLLELPDGRYLGNIYTLVNSYPNIEECQFRQRSLDHLEVHLVRAPGFTDEDLAAVRAKTEDLVGSGVRVEVIMQDHIERTPRGKLKLVVTYKEDAREAAAGASDGAAGPDSPGVSSKKAVGASGE